jgi:hypothetical protein
VTHPKSLDLNESLRVEWGESGLHMVSDLIADHSWWVSPKVYHKIKVVYPKARRRHAGESRGDIVDGNRLWYNEPAQWAFWRAVGCSKPRNSVICHIYEGTSGDPKHYTNLANMTALPICLGSLSEWEPVQSLLKYHSFKVFGYKGPKRKAPPRPGYYPKHWRHQVDPANANDLVRKLRRQRSLRPQGLRSLRDRKQ